MKSITFLLSCLSWIAVADASILKGFSTTDVPELEDIPNIAEQIRRISAETSSSSQHDRTLKSSGKSKKDKDKDKPEAADDSSTSTGAARQSRNADLEREFPFIPEAPPEFDADGELSFVILMDEFGYNSEPVALGTKFAFSGRLATDSFQVGQSSGSCTIGSDINTNFACCTFFLTFNTEGMYGFGTVALSGNTDEAGGYLQVTGTSGDLAATARGTANLIFDPAGNPIIYILIRLY